MDIKKIKKFGQWLLWSALLIITTFILGSIALHRNEPINSLWLITAAICIYLLGYRFYSAWIATRILMIDPNRPTPAVRFNDGRDYVPTHKWITFGHHFAAIAGPGPLIGPTLAAQFGYLPGTLWILIGAVLGGCVQDMVVMFCSVRRNGKTLSKMAKDELGRFGGIAAMLGTIMIMVILIAVLGLVVVNAMKHSPWATSTVFMTIPIAMFIGFYMRYFRPGRVLEASLIGLILMLLSVIGGKWIQDQPLLFSWFNHGPLILAWCIIAYGFLAAVLPVWLLLAPRDYLSTFLKLGTIFLLALAIILLRPSIQMPALTQFTDGHGPIFAGTIFPFMFITIACGAISGFHALVSSGTTPKLLASEAHIRQIGYGSMALESFVALMALIAATILEPGIFFAINSPAGIVGENPTAAASLITSWGFPVTAERMASLAQNMGETTLFGRTGGAPSLAVGMASIFGSVFGDHLLAVWYHFAIMFEAVFILTTLDAGTRICRFMIQDILGYIVPPLGRTTWYPSILITSTLAVASWGYFLYAGVIDPNGGINMLWPLFGMSNQILAAIALCVVSAILIKSEKLRYTWITIGPLIWLVIVTTVTAWHKLTSSDIRIGALAAARDLSLKLSSGILPADKSAIAPQLITNQYIVAGLSLLFIILLWVVVIDTIIVSWRYLNNKHKTNMGLSNEVSAT